MHSGEQEGFSTTTGHHSSPGTEAAMRAELYITCEDREKGDPAVQAHGTDGSGELGFYPTQGRKLRPARPLRRRSDRTIPEIPAPSPGAGAEKGVTVLFHLSLGKLFSFSAAITQYPARPGDTSKVPAGRPSPPRTPSRSDKRGTVPPPGRTHGSFPIKPGRDGSWGGTHAAVVSGPVHHGLVVRRIPSEREGGAAQPQLLCPSQPRRSALLQRPMGLSSATALPLGGGQPPAVARRQRPAPLAVPPGPWRRRAPAPGRAAARPRRAERRSPRPRASPRLPARQRLRGGRRLGRAPRPAARPAP